MRKLENAFVALLALSGLTTVGCAPAGGPDFSEADGQPYDPEESEVIGAEAEAAGEPDLGDEKLAMLMPDGSESALEDGLIHKGDPGGGGDWNCSGSVDVTVSCTGSFDYCQGKGNVMVRCGGTW